MNILVFSWRDPKHPLAGGAEQVMHEHMKGWIAAGHKVTLFSSKMKDLSSSENLDGIRVVRRGYQYLGVQVAGFFYYLANRGKYDFLVDQFHGIPFFTPLFSSRPKLAVIQEHAHEVWLKNPLPWPLNWAVGAIGYFFDPFVFLFYKRVPFMTGSASARADLVKLSIAKENIHVIPHGVITPEMKIRYKKERIPTIVYLGILSKDKGIEDAIKCFKFLNQKGNYQFWVIGKPETGEYSKRIGDLVSSLGLAGQIKFWGGRDKVSDLKKFELLGRSHVMVNPSIREGWGLVNIEANSVGTPIVAYRSPGLVDSVKEGVSGVFCKANTPQAMAELIMSLFKDPRLLRRLASSAVSWSKNFDWQKSKKMGLKLVERVYDEN